MPHRNLIVMGASMGGIEAYSRLLANLPRELNAAILLVQHMSPSSPGNLPDILARTCTLPVKAAVDGETPQSGHVYVAVPDHHLMLEGSRLRLSRGPRESRARPSVDVLFRSAAYHSGPRVIGVILTGMLDDGTAGLWAIKDRGGITIVQNPNEAVADSMPVSAVRHVGIDFILNLRDIAAKLAELTQQPLEHPEDAPMPGHTMRTEVDIALENSALGGVLSLGEATHYTCPECHGSMVRIKEGPIERYRCHTGHAYSEKALADEGASVAEKTLWSALAQLEEHYLLLKRLAERSADDAILARRYLESAAEIERMMQQTRRLALDPALRPPVAGGA